MYSVCCCYFRRTSGNQNIGQNQIDGESEENAVSGDLRHGVRTPSKHYSAREYHHSPHSCRFL